MLVQKLGLTGNSQIDFKLLDLGLTHPTFCEKDNYQQLEFIGDSVVRLAAAEILWEIYPEAPVGEFTALRAEMVSDRTLAEFAEHYSLETYLKLSSSAQKDEKGRCKRLADAFEGILGALYLSTHTLELIRPWLDQLLIDKAGRNSTRSRKTQLQRCSTTMDSSSLSPASRVPNRRNQSSKQR